MKISNVYFQSLQPMIGVSGQSFGQQDRQAGSHKLLGEVDEVGTHHEHIYLGQETVQADYGNSYRYKSCTNFLWSLHGGARGEHA